MPAEVRQKLGIRPGAQLIWEQNEQGEMVVRPKRCTLEDLHRVLGQPKVRLSIEELHEARLESWKARAAEVGEIKR